MALVKKVPQTAISQLSVFYSVVDGIPCLDSLHIYSCTDATIFEWWDRKELWLGQRDFYVLRWFEYMFCIGDATNVCFADEDAYPNFVDALRHIMTVYD